MGKAREKLKVVRSAAGLRDALFQELEDYRNGRVSMKEAATTVNIARAIIDSARLELLGVAIGNQKQLPEAKMQGVSA